jgi:hypothetical protein
LQEATCDSRARFGAKTTAYERQSIGLIAAKLLKDKESGAAAGKAEQAAQWVVKCFDSGEPATWRGKFAGWYDGSDAP